MKKLFILILLLSNIIYAQETIDSYRNINRKVFENSFKTNLEFANHNVYFSKGSELIYEEMFFKDETKGLLWSYLLSNEQVVEDSRINEIEYTIYSLYAKSERKVVELLDKCGVSFIYFQYNYLYKIDNQTKMYQKNYLIEMKDLKNLDGNYSTENLKSIIKRI